MPKPRNPNRDKALQLWKDSGGNRPLKDIAEELGVTSSTVRKWKSQDKWDEEHKRSAPKHKGSAPFNSETKKISKTTTDLISNADLRDKQKQFCIYYLQRFNATWAYMQAYDVDYRTANVNGPRLLGNASVREQIDRLRSGIVDDLMLEADDIAKQYAKQAFADIGDYVEFKTEMEQVMALYGPMVDKDKNPVMQKRSRVYLKDDEDVDTSLIKSVKVGKDGPVVELYDKQKAMDALMNYVGEKQTLKGQLMQAQIDRLKIQNGDNDPDEDDDDGFLEAIDKSAKDVWSDE
ncbi:terminase small subunit [Latilactobacillus sakei]|uniref:terminase small subunit n=1 Tax=Latilactobacillus sakei TaxID=1599 RepID=UPI0025A4E999|nr:terminase small subunit [Latilactobacillus sakei]MDM5043894.1 terminase small subunit [Latilactobacillus sakei]